MDRLFSVLQTTASCCKRSKIGLGPGFVWCPTGQCPRSLVVFWYINDISTDIDSEIRLFADDCVCYREIKDTEDTLKLQKNIDQFGYWARKWGMRFQPVKCNMMQIRPVAGQGSSPEMHFSFLKHFRTFHSYQTRFKSIKGLQQLTLLRFNTKKFKVCDLDLNVMH